MSELVTKGEVIAALLAVGLDPVTFRKSKIAIGKLPTYGTLKTDKPLKDWTLEEIRKECSKTIRKKNNDKLCFEICKCGEFCFQFLGDVLPEYWIEADEWNKTP